MLRHALPERRRQSDARAVLPLALVILSALSFVALAAHERFAGRLALATRTERHA